MDDEAAETDDRSDHQGGDQVRREPVLLLPLVEANLQRGDADRQQADTPVVDPGGPPLDVGRVEHVGAQHGIGGDSERDVDVEHPSPGVVVGQPPAEHRTEHRGHDDADAEEGHRLPAVLGLERLEHDRLRQRLHHAAGHALDDPPEHQNRKAGGQAAQNRRRREAGHRQEQQPAPAEVVRQPPGDRQDDRVGGQVRGERPGRLLDARGQVAGDMRQRHVHDRGVQHDHERAEHHRDGDDPGAWRGPRVRHVPTSCRPSARPTCRAAAGARGPAPGRGQSSPECAGPPSRSSRSRSRAAAG